jgi:hypothetical protein
VRAGLGWILGLIVAVLAMPAPASAGTYVVHSCAFPDGTPAPIDGWTFQSDPVVWAQWRVTCLDPAAPERAMQAWLTPDAGVTAYGQWVFRAPADTALVGYTLYRHEASSGGGPTRAVGYSYDDGGVIDGCFAWPQGCTERGTTDPRSRFSAANLVEHGGINTRTLTIAVRCSSVGADPGYPCPPGPGGISIYAARMSLSDAKAPVLDAEPAGSLVDSSQPLDGVETVSAIAHDAGGGLARATLLVDDVSVEQAAPAAAGPACAEPYAAVVPCPLRSSFTVAFDTGALSNGAHRLRLVITDAANNTAASREWMATFTNVGAPNGSVAHRLATLTARLSGASNKAPLQHRVAFGRATRLRGRLADPSGHPIANASLDVAFRVLRPGSQWTAGGVVTTGADGTWTLFVPRGASREVRVSYRAFSRDELPSRELVARVDVAARVRLAVTPRRIGRRGRVRFRGMLVGGPGREGAQVALYAVDRRGGSRVPVAILRCDSRGRFRYSYRFSRTPGPTTYRFVAVADRQQGYPYAAGRSPIVPLRVG